MNHFVSGSICTALKGEELKKERELDNAYEAANMDLDRLKTLCDWNASYDLRDLIDDDEEWNWL